MSSTNCVTSTNSGATLHTTICMSLPYVTSHGNIQISTMIVNSIHVRQPNDLSKPVKTPQKTLVKIKKVSHVLQSGTTNLLTDSCLCQGYVMIHESSRLVDVCKTPPKQGLWGVLVGLNNSRNSPIVSPYSPPLTARSPLVLKAVL